MYISVLLFMCIVQCCCGERTSTVKNCDAHEIDSSKHQNISSYFQWNQTVEIGFLQSHVNNGNIGTIQIFIYLPPHYEKFVDILLKDWSNITLSYDNTRDRKSTTKPIPKVPDSISWVYLVIKFSLDSDRPTVLVSVSRPEEIFPLAEIHFDLHVTEFSRFRYKVVSSTSSYAVFNCRKGCPMFTNISSEFDALHMETLRSFNIHIFPFKTEGEFSYIFNMTLNDGKTYNEQENLPIPKNIEAVLGITLQKSKLNNSLAISWNDKIIFQKSSSIEINSIQYLFWSTSGHRWTLDCAPPQKSGKSLVSGKMNPYRPPKLKKVLKPGITEQSTLGLGEIVAWIVAVVAICGVIIMAFTLYSKARESPETFISAASHMDHEFQYDDHFSLQMAEFKPQVSFRRKPAEESSEPRTSVINTGTLTREHFYPMKISTDDELSLHNEDIQSSTK